MILVANNGLDGLILLQEYVILAEDSKYVASSSVDNLQLAVVFVGLGLRAVKCMGAHRIPLISVIQGRYLNPTTTLLDRIYMCENRPSDSLDAHGRSSATAMECRPWNHLTFLDTMKGHCRFDGMGI